MSSPRPSAGGHIPGTEGIRGPLCVLIVWYHAYLYTAPGGPPTTGVLYTGGVSRVQLGLSVFFILSAFLLYRPFVQSTLRGRPRPAFGAYLLNRLARIMPVYWLVLAAALVFGVTIINVPTHDIGVHVPTALANAFLVHGLHPSGIQTGVPPAWSLAVEWAFYLLLPLLVLLALRAGGRAATRQRRLIGVLVPALLLILLGIVGKELARRTGVDSDPYGVRETWHAVVERSFLNWADLFGLGMVLAVARVEFEDGHLRLPRHWRPAALAFWVVGTWVLIAAHETGRLEWHHYNLLVGVPLAAFVAAVVLWSGEVRRDPLLRVLEWRPFVRLGEVSLSVYLLHYPIITFLVVHTGWFASGWLGMAWNCLLVTAIVLPLSWLTYRLVEVPAVRHKFRGKADGPPPLPAAVPPAVAAEPARV